MKLASGAWLCTLGFVLGTTSCSRGEKSAPVPAIASTMDAGPADAANDANAIPANPTQAGLNEAKSALRDASTASPVDPRPPQLVSAKSIGNTSVVLKLTFDSGAKAAFKPRSKRGHERYRGELAAFRLAQALDLRHVPDAEFVKFPLNDLVRALAPEARSLELARKELVADGDGQVPGALIPWIVDLQVLALENEPLRSKWRRWLLSTDAIDDADDRALAAQIATMVIFDAVTGNWDRWSGANVGLSGKTRTLLFIDNDGAFMVARGHNERQRELLRGLKKMPRAMVQKLRALDYAAMKLALGDASPGDPLLSEVGLRELETRRKWVLSEVDARVRELGEARLFVFE